MNGDPGWLKVWEDLHTLHVTKARDYGSNEDQLANYVQTSEVVGECDEYYPWLRLL